MNQLVQKLDGFAAGVWEQALRTTDDVVLRALREAEALLATTGPASAIDRVHTALHAHVLSICKRSGVEIPDTKSLTSAFKALRTTGLLVSSEGVRSAEIGNVLMTMANGIDALNNIRNNASSAHPSEELLEFAEATLVIQSARTLLNYLDAKFIRP